MTSGDKPDVLVAFNPAGLKANLADLRKGGILIVDSGNFDKKHLELVGYETNPLEDGSLQDYTVYQVEMTKLTVTALTDLGLKPKIAKRCSNFFALGLTYWLYNRPLDPTIDFLGEKFANKPEIVEANVKALKAGFHYGDTAEAIQTRYKVEQSDAIPAGTYRRISGNQAVAMGMITAAKKANIELSTPVTPSPLQ